MGAKVSSEFSSDANWGMRRNGTVEALKQPRCRL
jgi:hypothetical protein